MSDLVEAKDSDSDAREPPGKILQRLVGAESRVAVGRAGSAENHNDAERSCAVRDAQRTRHGKVVHAKLNIHVIE